MGCPKDAGEACAQVLDPITRQHVIDSFFILAGIIVIIAATGMAIRTFMIPGGAAPLFNRVIFRITQAIFEGASRVPRSAAQRHQILSLYAPISLLFVLAFILMFIGFGYTLAFYGIGVKPFIRALLFSGSALSTLGFESPGNNFWVIVFSVIEALTVATVVALLIGYLPNIYSSYQEREQAVSNLDDMTGTPPDGIKVIDAYVDSFGTAKFGELWQDWLNWFNALGASGSTLSGELYLRSSSWDRSWITAAGAMLDAAALIDACVDLASDPAADRLVRLGSRSLHAVLEPLRLRCPDNPQWPGTTINVTRQEFDAAYDHLQQKGLPMKADRDAAWASFAQHRAHYECALMSLVRLKKPPHGARWTTDRVGGDVPLELPVFGVKKVIHKPGG